MSGGLWDYQDQNISDQLKPIMLPGIMQALEEAFHEVDWAESDDTSRETAEPRIYDIIKKLGDDMFNRRPGRERRGGHESQMTRHSLQK
jgi:hypothetical protein